MIKRVLGNFDRGLIFVVSAPAGTGKTTLVNMLIQEFSCVVASVSFTTRKPRSGEIEGVHYYFLSEEEFANRIAKGEFLEYVKLYGNYYGTSRLWLQEQQEKGKHVILVIDTQGVMQLREKLNATSIFISPPSIEELEKRLKSRETESWDMIEKRLMWAKEEMKAQERYDYRIVNDDLATAYQVLRSILIAEEHRMRYYSG